MNAVESNYVKDKCVICFVYNMNEATHYADYDLYSMDSKTLHLYNLNDATDTVEVEYINLEHVARLKLDFERSVNPRIHSVREQIKRLRERFG